MVEGFKWNEMESERSLLLRSQSLVIGACDSRNKSGFSAIFAQAKVMYRVIMS